MENLKKIFYLIILLVSLSAMVTSCADDVLEVDVKTGGKVYTHF